MSQTLTEYIFLFLSIAPRWVRFSSQRCPTSHQDSPPLKSLEDAENEYDPTGFVQSRNNENRLPSANPSLEEPLVADRYDKDPGAVGVFHVRVQNIINCFQPRVKGTKR